MVLFTNFPPPTEGVRLELEDTRAFVGSRDIGVGCLYIAESRLAWKSSTGIGFSLEYPAISLHAVSKDPNTFPFECIYLMVDGKFPETDPREMGAGDMAQDDENSEEDDDENPISEIRFVPSDKGTIPAMYDALSACQNLHPDPADTDSEDSEEEEDEGFGYEQFVGEEPEEAKEGMMAAGSEGQVASRSNGHATDHSQHGDPVVDPVAQGLENMDVGQFEDAEMDT